MPVYYVNVPCIVTNTEEHGHLGASEPPKSFVRVAVWAYSSEDAVDRVRRALEHAITIESEEKT